MPLNEADRTKLDQIVLRMTQDGQSPDTIRMVVADFQQKYGTGMGAGAASGSASAAPGGATGVADSVGQFVRGFAGSTVVPLAQLAGNAVMHPIDTATAVARGLTVGDPDTRQRALEAVGIVPSAADLAAEAGSPARAGLLASTHAQAAAEAAQPRPAAPGGYPYGGLDVHTRPGVVAPAEADPAHRAPLLMPVLQPLVEATLASTAAPARAATEAALAGQAGAASRGAGEAAGGLALTLLGARKGRVAGPGGAAGGAAEAGAAAAGPASETARLGLTTEIPKTLGQRTGSSLLQRAEGVVGGSIFGRPLQKLYKAQSEALRTLTDEVSAKIGASASPTERGVAVQGFIRDVNKLEREAASGLFKELDQVAGNATRTVEETVWKSTGIKGPLGEAPYTYPEKVTRIVTEPKVPVDTAGIVKAAEELKAAARQGPFAESEVSRVTRQLDETIGQLKDKKIGFMEAMELRSRVREMADSLAGPTPLSTNRARGLAKLFGNAVEDAMQGAAERSGVPGLAEKMRGARSQWAKVSAEFDNRYVKRLLDAPPETVAEVLRQSPTRVITNFKDWAEKNGRTDLLQSVKRQIAEEIFSNATSPMTGELRGQVAATRLKGGAGRQAATAERTAALFTGQERAMLDQVSKEALQIAQRGTSSGKALDMFFGIGVATGMATGHFVPALAAGGGANLFARAAARQPGKSLAALRRGVAALNRGNTPQAQFWAGKLAQIAAEGDQGQEQEQEPARAAQ